MTRRLAPHLLLITLFTSPLQAGFLVGPGATGDAFLKIPIAARATAMGGAVTAITGDAPVALEYNPAGLIDLDRADVGATLINYVEDSQIQSVTIGFPVLLSTDQQLGDGFFGPDSNKIFLGFSYRGFSTDDTARDELGAALETFDIKSQVFQASLGYTPFERLGLGVSGKYAKESLGESTADNILIDAGLIWRFTGTLQGGVSILNFGQGKAFLAEGDPPPTMLRGGLSTRLKQFIFTADLITGRDKVHQQALGAEWNPYPIIHFRGGLINGTSLDYAAGLGLILSPSVNKISPAEKERRAKRKILDELDVPKDNPVYDQYSSSGKQSFDFGIDYALRSHADLDLSHTVTLKVLF